MPFANPDKRRQYQSEYLRKKYATNPEFRKAEAKRKAEWFQRPGIKESRALALKRWREKERENRKKPVLIPIELAILLKINKFFVDLFIIYCHLLTHGKKHSTGKQES